MKTNWTAPGKGATVEELSALLGIKTIRRSGYILRIDHPLAHGKRTNLGISSTGVVEYPDHERARFAEIDY